MKNKKNLSEFIMLISRPFLCPDVSKEKVYINAYREFMSFCFSVGNGRVALDEQRKNFSKKKMITDLAKITKYHDIHKTEKQRLNNLPDETTAQGKYNAMLDRAFCERPLELLSVALNVIGNPEKHTFSIPVYKTLINKADEILAKIN